MRSRHLWWVVGNLVITDLSMKIILTCCFSANRLYHIAMYRVPNIPPQNRIVGTSSPISGPAIAYVTFNFPCLSVSGRVKIWCSFRGAMILIACSSGEMSEIDMIEYCGYYDRYRIHILDGDWRWLSRL